MKELKHLAYFESLLLDGQNELVTKAKSAGRRALGYNCYYIPEPLLNLPGCFSVRFRAPRLAGADAASYYLGARSCPYARALFERAIEGGFGYFDALFFADTCAAMGRVAERVSRGGIPVSRIDPPVTGGRASLDYYKAQLRLKLLEPLRDRLGVDVSDAAIRAAINGHNELSRLISGIGGFRKLANPPITGYEFHVIRLVSQLCPHELIMPRLEETLKELRARKPDGESPFGARAVLAGCGSDDPGSTRLIEARGAMVAAEGHCFGGRASRGVIEPLAGESAFDAVCRHYLEQNPCARFMDSAGAARRRGELMRLAEEYRADGVVFKSMKFCEFWGCESLLMKCAAEDGFGLPCCTLEMDCAPDEEKRLRAGLQTFTEALEARRIRGGRAT